MDNVVVLLEAGLALFCAYRAGQLATALEIDEADGITSDRWLFWLWLFNLAFAVYFIIAFYGAALGDKS